MSLLKTILRKGHIHFHRFHHREGSVIYTKCRCGKRGWHSVDGGYSPLDRDWLLGKDY